MTSHDESSPRERTAAALHDTAEQLEVAEDILHNSADRSPDPATRRRLHALGDEVTAQAKLIDARADPLSRPHADHRS